jgi:hypothetical protein
VATPRSSDGRRDLALISASGSTARVLNLALVFERHGGSPDFQARPLFRSMKLNRSLVIKHALRPHERALFERPEPHTTKIVFPYSSAELGLGGTSVMVGERKFDQLLRGAIGASVDEDAFQADFDLLNVLHEMPSFDPFMLREQLRRAGAEPARCFFDISDADIAQMVEFVSDEIAPLTRLAFGAGGRRAANLSMRLAEKLMTDENAKFLDPLRATLRLSASEYVRGVFAWKGFLYYKWLTRNSAEQRAVFDRAFAACAIRRSDMPKRIEAEKLRQSVIRRIGIVSERTAAMLGEYNKAFDAFAASQPVDFRDFLLQAPAHFAALGEATGALSHIVSFWRFRFPEAGPASLDPDEAIEIFSEFDVMLSGVELGHADAENELFVA